MVLNDEKHARRSCGDICAMSPNESAPYTMLRWLWVMPFGSPVEPEV